MAVGDGEGESDKRMRRLLKKTEQESVFPDVSRRLHEAVSKGKASTYVLEKLLFTDANLALNIVRRTSEIAGKDWTTARQLPIAIETIGLVKLNTVVMGLEVASRALGSTTVYQSLWSHALRTATIARAIALQTQTVSEDDAFVAGVFHDFGVIMFRRVGSSSYPRLLRRSGVTLVGLDLLERDRYGFDHGEVVHRLLTMWGTCQPVLDGVFSHHDETPSMMGAIINVADNIDVFGTIGLSVSDVAQAIYELPMAARIGLTVAQYEKVIHDAKADAGSIMSVVSGV